MAAAMSMRTDDDAAWGAGTVPEDASSQSPQQASATATTRQHDADGATTALTPYPDVDWMKDWVGINLFQFFRDVEGFHLGDLDLLGRYPSRYEELKRKWDAYLKDFGRLTPYVDRADVERPHFDLVSREWIYEEYSAEGVTHRELWNAFCSKWRRLLRAPPFRYEDLAALTEHARGIVAAHPQPKFQKIMLDDMPPEIIHGIFSHISEGCQDGHNLAATSKLFREIGCSHIFEFRNIALGADKFLQKLDAGTRPPESTLAEIREKLSADRGPLLEHIAYLASRPDICRRIRRLRVANNWCNPVLVGPGADDICREHQNDVSIFGPVLRALDDLLALVSLTSLDLEFISLDERVLRRICAQEHLVEVNLKGCVVHWMAQSFCRGEIYMRRPGAGPSPHHSRIRYLGLTHVRFPPASSIWDFLAMCPDLLSLQATGCSQSRGFGLPTLPSVTALCSALRSLERLELYLIASTQITTVSTWLDSAHYPLRLNHVKLVFNFGISNDQAAGLLRALHRGRPPLRTLVLDGPTLRGPNGKEGEPSMLDLIAELFPDLEGLALAHRAPWQHDSGPCAWPRFMHTYAPALRAFTRLRTFGANFDVWNLGVASSVLANFYPVEIPHEFQTWEAASSGSEGTEELLNHVLAAPFAAACPSLRYFVATGDWSTPLYCIRIARTEAGIMDIENTMPCDPADTPEVLRLYNPSRLLRYDSSG